jgi:hypothetical protein
VKEVQRVRCDDTGVQHAPIMHSVSVRDSFWRQVLNAYSEVLELLKARQLLNKLAHLERPMSLGIALDEILKAT